MSEKLGSPEDRALWRAVAGGSGSGTDAAVSLQDVAAWLDGRLGPAAAARVEAALARDPALLSAALDARAVLDETLPAAPDRLLVRGRAIVAPPAGVPSSPGSTRWFGGWRLAIQWGAVAAMTIGVSVGGFSLGGATQGALASQRDWGGVVSAVFYSIGDPGLASFGDLETDQ